MTRRLPVVLGLLGLLLLGLGASPEGPAPPFDCLVVGAGPSGLALSAALAGLEPHLTSHAHPTPSVESALRHVRARPPALSGSHSQLTQALAHSQPGFAAALSRVVSRSVHPTSTLLDSVMHPQADGGTQPVAGPLVQFKRTGRRFRHAIVDQGSEGGGQWRSNTMPNDTLTLSPGHWMILPEEAEEEEEGTVHGGLPGAPLGEGDQLHRQSARALRSEVAKYYEQYFRRRQQENEQPDGLPAATIALGMTVTSVRREEVKDGLGSTETLWRVTAEPVTNVSSTCSEPRSWLTRALVLATGTVGLPKLLDVEGELDIEGVRHTFDNSVLPASPKPDGSMPVLLVVGAGLTAADACLRALKGGWKVRHSFRQEPEHTKLASMFGADYRYFSAGHTRTAAQDFDWEGTGHTYAEYLRLLSFMHGGQEEQLNYIAMPSTSVLQFGNSSSSSSKSQVSVTVKEGGALRGDALGEVITVDRVAVLIGSQPNLGFLPEDVRDELKSDPAATHEHAGRRSKHPVWVDADAFTGQHPSIQPALFVAGPLRGDNFVRFVWPDAFGIVARLADILEKRS